MHAKTANQGVFVVYMELDSARGTTTVCDFSLKPFVGPTPTPQSYYEMAYSAMGRRRCLCSEVTFHDPSGAIMSEQALAHLVGGPHWVPDNMPY